MSRLFALAACLVLVFSASLGRAGTVAMPFEYRGTGSAGAGFDVLGDIFIADGDQRMLGPADVFVTLDSGSIHVREVRGFLNSATWTGTGTFVNPQFQTVEISVEIVTNPTNFWITSAAPLPLMQDGMGGLEWESPQGGIPGMSSLFNLSGTYTLRGPTEMVEGSFDHTFGTREVTSGGRLLTENFPDEITIVGGLGAFFPESFRPLDLVLVDDTVDGVPINLHTVGIRSGMGGGSGTLLLIPEPNAGLLFLLAPAGWAFRRRR